MQAKCAIIKQLCHNLPAEENRDTRITFEKVILLEHKRHMSWLAAGLLSGLIAVMLLSGCSSEAVNGASFAKPLKTVASVTDLSFYKSPYDGVVMDGVSALDVDLSGMSQEQARAEIEQASDAYLQNLVITLNYNDSTWSYSAADLGYSMDVDSMVSKVWSYAHNGNAAKDKEDMAKKADGIQIGPELVRNEEVISQKVTDIASSTDKPMVDAAVTFQSDGTATVSDSQTGYELNQSVTKAQIEQGVEKEDSEKTFSLVVAEIAPKYTKESLDTSYTLLSEFTTYYYEGETDRNKNLATAASKINGTILMPGDQFNFGDTVSPVTYEEGYADANTIINGVYVPSIGGGLCQVSTTLYNAVVYAELQVDERNEHAYPAHYVPYGMDAMVSVPFYYNMKFTNDSGYPVYLTMTCSGGAITARIYGHEIHDPSRQISFDYEVTGYTDPGEDQYIVDETLPAGTKQLIQSATKGLSVDVYKTVTEKGQTTKELFSHSDYEASPNVYKVGPGTVTDAGN